MTKRYEGWTQEKIETFRAKSRERMKERRKTSPRDRTKEYEKRKEQYKQDPVYREKIKEQAKPNPDNPNYLVVMDKRRKLRRDKRIQIKTECAIYLGNKCKNCQQKYHPNVYDFHHRNPKDKEENLSSLFKQECFKMTDKVKKELDKCDLLCANCHRFIHAFDELKENRQTSD